jgi:hypothetical protein
MEMGWWRSREGLGVYRDIRECTAHSGHAGSGLRRALRDLVEGSA